MEKKEKEEILFQLSTPVCTPAMDPPEYDLEKSREFHWLVVHKPIEEWRDLAKDPEVDLNWKNSGGWTAFHCACSQRYLEHIQFFLCLDGAQLNLKTDNGNTPFSVVCGLSSPKKIALFIDDPRIDINQPDNDNETPFFRACRWSSPAVAERMLASRRRIDTTTVSNFWNMSAAQQLRQREEHDFADVVERYQKNPTKVALELRKKLGLSIVEDIAELFALVIFFSDGHLQLKEKEGKSKEVRFFSIASRIPMEIQMLLCHRVFGSMGVIVKTTYSEPAFQKYAKE